MARGEGFGERGRLRLLIFALQDAHARRRGHALGPFRGLTAERFTGSDDGGARWHGRLAREFMGRFAPLAMTLTT